MKVDTLFRLGSLAFGIAQDEKIRELLKMTHNGAKRRGWLSPSSASSTTGSQPYIPFSPAGRPPQHGPRQPWL